MWLGDDAKITVDIWNVHSENEKQTNNHVEGWKSKFTKLVGKHHPNICEFVEAATELTTAHCAQQGIAVPAAQRKTRYMSVSHCEPVPGSVQTRLCVRRQVNVKFFCMLLDTC